MFASLRSLLTVPALLLLPLGLAQPLPADSASVFLASQVAAPGSSVVVPVMFQSSAAPVSAIQFDIQYDSSSMSLFANLGDAARNSGKVFYQLDLAPGARRFLIVGLNSSVMASGSLFNLFVNLGPNAATGAYSLSFSNVTAADPAGVIASISAADGTITVAGTIAQSVPLQSEGVLNGASLTSGPLAPGEIFTLIGSNIGASKTTQVSFDGIAATLFYIGTSQINGMAPYELAGRAVTQMEITGPSGAVSELAVPVAAASPAIFTLDASGVGQGAILNQDLAVNSPTNPASRGAIVVLYATGSGQITGTDPATPILPVAVQIGGADSEVLYAGTVAGLITGLLQVNCLVPTGVSPGYAVPVTLTVGGLRSTQNVTLAVQ